MRYAIIEKNQIANVILIEPEIADKDFPEAIQETESTGEAWIGARFNGEKFEPRKQYDSWVWNEDTFDYDPPKPKPEDGQTYTWDEPTLDWVLVEPTDTEA